MDFSKGFTVIRSASAGKFVWAYLFQGRWLSGEKSGAPFPSGDFSEERADVYHSVLLVLLDCRGSLGIFFVL